MKAFRTQTDGAEPRSMRTTSTSGRAAGEEAGAQAGRRRSRSRIYIDGVFEHHRWVQRRAGRREQHVHVMDDQSASPWCGWAPFPDDTRPAVQYHLGDHLGSSNVVIDDAGRLVNREEYHALRGDQFRQLCEEAVSVYRQGAG